MMGVRRSIRQGLRIVIGILLAAIVGCKSPTTCDTLCARLTYLEDASQFHRISWSHFERQLDLKANDVARIGPTESGTGCGIALVKFEKPYNQVELIFDGGSGHLTSWNKLLMRESEELRKLNLVLP